MLKKKRPFGIWAGLIAAYLLAAPLMIGLQESDETNARSLALGNEPPYVRHFGCAQWIPVTSDTTPILSLHRLQKPVIHAAHR